MGLNKRLIDQAGGAAGVTNTDNFDIVTYTGNSSTQSISSLDFAPDLVFIKCLSDAFAPVWFDTVRGTLKALWSSENYAQQNDTDTISSFDTNGFTTGDDNKTNRSAENYISFCWKGGGTAVSNTDGATTSQVSANPDAGFSIASWTTTSSTINTTIGHGLGVIPDLYIIKSMTAAEYWIVGSSQLAANKALKLNELGAQFTTSGFNSTYPTSSVASVNINAGTYVGYFFANVDGYQKIGSYVGDGNTSQTITTDFQPRILIVKDLDNSSHWFCYNSVRSTGEGTSNAILINNSASEFSNRDGVSFISTGFTIYDGDNYNVNTRNYIYIAIA